MPSNRDEVARMALEGYSDEDMMSSLGLSKSRVRALRREAGIKRPPHGAFGPEVIQKIQAAAAEGWPPCEIAETLGVSTWSATKYCDDPTNGSDWNRVARWAARHHRKLFEELKR